MKKNIVQDIVPPKKSIRNVELPTRSKALHHKTAKKAEPEVVAQEETIETEPTQIHTKKVERSETREDVPSYTYEYDEPRGNSKKIKYFALVVLVIVLALGVSALFRSAEVKISPKQDSKVLSQVFTAKKDLSGGTGLPFQLVTLSKDMEKTVKATGEQNVEKKAQGKIVIYNNTASSQKLVATTRFQTPEGLVYRLVSPASIPGKTMKDGKSLAGSLEVTVEADKAGAEYNVALKDFTIPGFKGDSKFTDVYARSKTEMTGGFSGLQKTVSTETLAQAEKELEAPLREALSTDIVSGIPSDFILYKSSLSYSFDKVIQMNSANGDVVLRKKGTANAIILDRALLSKAILSKVMQSEATDEVKIVNLESLTFTFSSTSLAFDPKTSSSAVFGLTGNVNLVWTVDEGKVKSSVAGLSKKNAIAIIGTNANIKEAWVTTFPFWNQTIPKDIKKIEIINTFEKPKP